MGQFIHSSATLKLSLLFPAIYMNIILLTVISLGRLFYQQK